MRNIAYKLLSLLVVLFCLDMNAVTSLFESKDTTYKPYEYKKSEFETLGLSERIDLILKKLDIFSQKALEKKFDVNSIASHQLVKAIHAALVVERRLKLQQDEKAVLKKLDVVDSKRYKLEKRLENLKRLLTNFKGKNFKNKGQDAALYRVYKDLEIGLYIIDKPQGKSMLYS